MTQSADPLFRLVVDEAAIDREMLAEVLETRVRLDLTRGSFTFLPGVRDRMSNRQQVVAALLATKALHLLKDELPDGLHPQDLEAVTGIKGGTLRPLLRVLVERRVVSQSAEKAYIVPGFALEEAGRFLNERGD